MALDNLWAASTDASCWQIQLGLIARTDRLTNPVRCQGVLTGGRFGMKQLEPNATKLFGVRRLVGGLANAVIGHRAKDLS